MSSWGMSLIGLLAADGAGVCVRPVGVRPVAGRSGPDRGRGDNRCVAAVPDVLPGRGAARAGGRERGAVADRPVDRVGADLPVGRAPGISEHRAVLGGQGFSSWTAADPGRSADGVPVSPGRRRGAGRASTRTAALVRHSPGPVSYTHLTL